MKMHWKTKNKLLSANKIYLTFHDIDDEYCYEIRIQLPTNEFVLINFESDFPSTFEYLSLFPNGFNYNSGVDSPIVIFGQKDALDKLNQSIEAGNNNPSTVKRALSLVKCMNNLSFK